MASTYLFMIVNFVLVLGYSVEFRLYLSSNYHLYRIVTCYSVIESITRLALLKILNFF